ncbi:MAG: STAS domain-containing protein [Ruminococcus sp.]|nr:STAS domain-containing protein [Ruminococcus sp.]
MDNNFEPDLSLLERVNPVFNTAKVTLFQLSGAGDTDAAAIAEKLGLTLEGTHNTENSTVLPEQLLAGIVNMEARFKTMSKLAEQSNCSVLVDLPCGYTPRAIQMSRKGLRFIGLDLPATISEAEPAILSLIEPEKREFVQFSAVDATNYASLKAALKDESGEVCITTEGLLMYFTDSEAGELCDNIRRILEEHGGVWLTADPEITLFYILTLQSICGDRFMEIMMNAKQQMADKSDVKLGGNRLLIKPQDAAGSMKTAMMFLAEHGLKAERMILHDHLPELNSLSSLTPEQAATFIENMKKCAFWKITLADRTKQLDASDAGSSGFDVSANLDAATLNMAFNGRLDTITAPHLLAFYEAHKDQVKSVRIDCKKLDYISSAGLRVLLIMHKGCVGGVTLFGVNDVVREILEQTGFDAAVNIEE